MELTERVLIVNSCGLFSALPTISEYNSLNFATENKIIGLVKVTDEDAAAIFSEQHQVRVLLPNLPPPRPDEHALYIAVVDGVLKLV